MKSANRSLIESWDRAILAVGGAAVGLFFAGAVVFGDPTAPDSNLGSRNQPAAEVECLPLDMQTGATLNESLC